MSTQKVKLTEALFVPAGKPRIAEIVQLAGSMPRKGAVTYDPNKHADQIVCETCFAPLRAVFGLASVGGSSMTPRGSHLAAIKSHEVGCKWKYHSAARKHTPIDRALGYRVFIQTSSNPHGNQPGKLTDETRAMETFPVHSAREVANFLMDAHPARRVLSTFRFQGNEIPEDRFYIPLGDTARLLDLAERARNRPRGREHEPPFCAIEVETKEFYHPWKQEKGGNGLWRRVEVHPDIDYAVRLPDGQYIVVKLYVDNPGSSPRDGTAQSLFMPDRYLILGEVRYGQTKSKKGHYLNIKITDPRQVAMFDSRNMPVVENPNRFGFDGPSV